MPNSITVITYASPTSYVTSTSRYINSVPIYYGSENLVTFETYKRVTTPASTTDKYTVIPPGWEYRPDLVSIQAYGVPDFWYKIMEANGIYDIIDFKAGVNIRLPDSVM
jgi:hypothetical protein